MTPDTAAAAVAGAFTLAVTFLGWLVSRGGAGSPADAARETAEETAWEITQGLLSSLRETVQEQGRSIERLEAGQERLRSEVEAERRVSASLRDTVVQLRSLVHRLREAVVALESQVRGLGHTPVTHAGWVGGEERVLDDGDDGDV